MNFKLRCRLAGERMPACGTHWSLDPYRFEESLRQRQIEAFITPCAVFEARMVSAELHSLRLLRFEEEASRIGYLSLVRNSSSSPSRLLLAQPSDGGGPELRAVHIVFHSPGERFHPVTRGPLTWGTIALELAKLKIRSGLSGAAPAAAGCRQDLAARPARPDPAPSCACTSLPACRHPVDNSRPPASCQGPVARSARCHGCLCDDWQCGGPD